ncbi:tannase and feruloyl esterase [Rhizodiscina lignyota]|uniref:Carboxylic ester hydrolase n=1 Tax=Rhizodiscina lignyota TaxID=1504668 RepID=A0A9P4INY0_9PEZI|nr:tannase and feruloyl esterase [Rhizodiscina lignyota]
MSGIGIVAGLLNGDFQAPLVSHESFHLYNCSADAIRWPTLHGAEITSLQASLVQDFAIRELSPIQDTHANVYTGPLNFCNVTVTHTHPGQHDRVSTQIWLPLSPEWNERMKAVGGGGWIAGMHPGLDMSMANAISTGYAAVTTDGGLPGPTPEEWAILSPGNINLYTLQNFASVSLNDAAIVGKSIIHAFYGQYPEYSYWSGCSQGGRQGLMLAQRYPKAFDGIVANAPAINWNEFFIGGLFLQQLMNELRVHPYPCELDALTSAAINECDYKDGLVDGIISYPELCDFDPYTHVESPVYCADTGTTRPISTAAAAVAHAAWTGARGSNNEFLWYLPGFEANLTSPLSLAQTVCGANGCTGIPQGILYPWLTLFIKRNESFDFSKMTRREFESAFHTGVREFESIMGSNYPDLRDFRDTGGKMVTYHGLADPIIPSNGTRHYYEAVMRTDPHTHDYYRLFESPGLGHCAGGPGAFPTGIFNALVRWVEHGEVPEYLEATSFPDDNGNVKERILCPYPKRAKYTGKNGANSFDSFDCVDWVP